jgi:hypothetical protein
MRSEPTVTAGGFSGRSSVTIVEVADARGVVYQRQLRGGVVAVGNSILTCVDNGDDDECVEARNGFGKVRRQSHAMGYVDVDDNVATFNSSSARLTVPSGATVDHALLVWSANNPPTATALEGGGVDKATVMLSTPNGSQLVSGDVLDDDGSAYVAAADVTGLVSGTGNYTVANLHAALGVGKFGGWSLVVAFADQTMPRSQVTITTNSSGPRSIFGASRELDLGAVPAGDGLRDGALVWAVFEGDRSLGVETVSLNGVSLDGSGAGDLFNSTVPIDRTPFDDNTFGVDVDRFDVAIDADVTRMTLSIASPSDRLRWGAAGWTVEL